MPPHRRSPGKNFDFTKADVKFHCTHGYVHVGGGLVNWKGVLICTPAYHTAMARGQKEFLDEQCQNVLDTAWCD